MVEGASNSSIKLAIQNVRRRREDEIAVAVDRCAPAGRHDTWSRRTAQRWRGRQKWRRRQGDRDHRSSSRRVFFAHSKNTWRLSLTASGGGGAGARAGSANRRKFRHADPHPQPIAHDLDALLRSAACGHESFSCTSSKRSRAAASALPSTAGPLPFPPPLAGEDSLIFPPPLAGEDSLIFPPPLAGQDSLIFPPPARGAGFFDFPSPARGGGLGWEPAARAARNPARHSAGVEIALE